MRSDIAKLLPTSLFANAGACHPTEPHDRADVYGRRQTYQANEEDPGQKKDDSHLNRVE